MPGRHIDRLDKTGRWFYILDGNIELGAYRSVWSLFSRVLKFERFAPLESAEGGPKTFFEEGEA
jgi:hypothetical protein